MVAQLKTGAKCGADFSLPRGFSPAFSPALRRFFNGAVVSLQPGGWNDSTVDSMFIEVRQQYDGFCILHCEGALVPGPEMQYMEARLDKIGKLTCTRMLVDFQDVTAIGSMGVTFIVAAWKSVMRRPGGRFVLTRVNPRVRLVLDLTRISTVIPLAPDLASGLAILGAEATGVSHDCKGSPSPPPDLIRPFRDVTRC